MKTPHKYADILRWIADGETIQYRNHSKDKWETMRYNEDLLNDIASGGAWDPEDYRIDPKVVLVNGIEVPEPCRVALERNTAYFVPSVSNRIGYISHIWGGDPADKRFLGLGLVHTSIEAAVQHAKAMVAPTVAKG